MAGCFQLLAEAASHLPFAGDNFRGVADVIGAAREKVRELSDEIRGIPDNDVTITVNTVHHEQSVSGGGRGGRTAGGPVEAGSAYWIGERQGAVLAVARS